MNGEAETLVSYLREIAEKSNHGEIPWNQPNPSTFHWVSEDFSVTIQKAATLKLRGLLTMNLPPTPDDTSYLFQVQEKGSRQSLVSISSSERPEFFKSLDNVYHAAERGMDRRAEQVLKRLLARARTE